MITYPLNNILYSAEDAELFHCTRTSGVFSADDEFAVSVTGADNTVVIGPGIAWIRNAKFSGKVAANKTSVSLDMGLADGSYPRIDAVVIRFDANANQTSIVVKQGVAASDPVPPEVVRTEAIYELHLYHVRRGAGSTAVSFSDITDIRQDRNYCGVMMDDVTNIDENKFLSKSEYDPTGVVASQGGIQNYIKNTLKETEVFYAKISAITTQDYAVLTPWGENATVEKRRGEMLVSALFQIEMKSSLNTIPLTISGFPSSGINYKLLMVSANVLLDGVSYPVFATGVMGETANKYGAILALHFLQSAQPGLYQVQLSAIVPYEEN